MSRSSAAVAIPSLLALAFLALALFALSMLFAARLMRIREAGKSSVVSTAMLGILLALLYWTWSGSILYASVIAVALLVGALVLDKMVFLAAGILIGSA